MNKTQLKFIRQFCIYLKVIVSFSSKQHSPTSTSSNANDHHEWRRRQPPLTTCLFYRTMKSHNTKKPALHASKQRPLPSQHLTEQKQKQKLFLSFSMQAIPKLIVSWEERKESDVERYNNSLCSCWMDGNKLETTPQKTGRKEEKKPTPQPGRKRRTQKEPTKTPPHHGSTFFLTPLWWGGVIKKPNQTLSLGEEGKCCTFLVLRVWMNLS